MYFEVFITHNIHCIEPADTCVCYFPLAHNILTMFCVSTKHMHLIQPIAVYKMNFFHHVCIITTQEPDGEFRIFFVNSYSREARKILCEVSNDTQTLGERLE